MRTLYAKLRRQCGPLVPKIPHTGAAINRELPLASRNVRHMSVNTRGTFSYNTRKLAEEDGDDRAHEKARIYVQNAFQTSESSKQAEGEAVKSSREAFQEKQSDTHADFQKVKLPPPPSNQTWWHPDPFTGHFVPQTNYGEITSTVVLKERPITSPIAKFEKVETVGKKRPAPSAPFTRITGAPTKGEKGGWWTSMEELPDLDHFHKRC